MNDNINLIWNVLSTLLEENFTFTKIKQIVGLSGLDRTLLSDMEQKYSGGNSKSQLIKGTSNNPRYS